MQLPKLYKKRECNRLSWFSRLLIALIFLFSLILIRNHLYKFLSPIEPIQTNFLVVEGWMDDFALEETAKIFKEGHYSHIITTGGPLDMGGMTTHYISTAELAQATLIHLGIDSGKITAVPRKYIIQKRTLQSALALKQWIIREHPDLKSFNLVSLGPHSRRSHYLFQKALPNTKIGIIAIRDKRYDYVKWWQSSKGSRTVITEAIGYFYVLFFM
jgi:uncharacterized SAM-binding protein YcdF (DUF218 family)